ncbi:hypothetical protein OG455_33175 [Kitasatospora sp. NBC_01287]|uniref:hypothetical protein n=1 Tax=Kitasatospora sp. NBC_01287 TaxID=2903573 RepID=UPI002255C538|nr:hypothetical protein [Kitasatospora sp. NBC_01287]MCX4750307.1 hypothetical protein [Kitasatospora sp. NBC_01287]
MRHRLLATMALGTSLALAPLTATAASAATAAAPATAPTTVTADQCFNNGGYFGGYNANAQAFCTEGIYNGIPFDKDPNQGWCPTGQHIYFVYLKGLFCTVDVPNT